MLSLIAAFMCVRRTYKWPDGLIPNGNCPNGLLSLTGNGSGCIAEGAVEGLVGVVDEQEITRYVVNGTDAWDGTPENLFWTAVCGYCRACTRWHLPASPWPHA